MRFIHASKTYVSELTSFTDTAGWENVLVVSKGTFSIPENGKTPQPLSPQALAMKDDFYGEPGLSAPAYENDFASRKARCDVLFKAQAHAPQGRPVKHLDVAVQVGTMAKAIHVVGNRRWEKDVLLVRHSEPEAFTTMPLHYGRAFGGSVTYTEDGKTLYDTYAANPVGVGYSKHTAFATLHGMALPNLEMSGRPLRRSDETYPAVALSPVARNFYPRYTFAGTYDQRWKDETAPFLPADFDARFFQCAPDDQQIAYPVGGEEVRLVNMMPGRVDVQFNLPPLGGMVVRVLDQNLQVTEIEAMPDILYFEPDEARFSVVWRAGMRLGHKGLHGVRMAVSGDICPMWWEAAMTGEAGCSGCGIFSADNVPQGCPHKEGFPAQRSAERERL